MKVNKEIENKLLFSIGEKNNKDRLQVQEQEKEEGSFSYISRAGDVSSLHHIQLVIKDDIWISRVSSAGLKFLAIKSLYVTTTIFLNHWTFFWDIF